jgi:hypothetical protein
MGMPAYTVPCSSRACRQPAQYKIAARWSDGVTEELKTYALSCADCLREAFLLSQDKRARCRLAPGEILEAPGIYMLRRGGRDRDLTRESKPEQRILSRN